MLHWVITRCKCHANNSVASRKSIQRVRIDVCQFFRIGYFAFISRGSHPDMRGSRWHSAVQHVTLQSSDSETHSLLFAGRQRLALESRLLGYSHKRLAHQQIARCSKLVPRTTALDFIPRTTRYTRAGHWRTGSEHERREHVSRRNY